MERFPFRLDPEKEKSRRPYSDLLAKGEKHRQESPAGSMGEEKKETLLPILP